MLPTITIASNVQNGNETGLFSKNNCFVFFNDATFAKRPREMLVWILEFFTVYEVASLQRLVSREFRDAGQERIHERGGRKLYEEGMTFMFGLDHKTIDEDRGWLLLHASLDAGCKTAFALLVIRGQCCVLSLVKQKMVAPNLSDEDKLKILKDFKEISTFQLPIIYMVGKIIPVKYSDAETLINIPWMSLCNPTELIVFVESVIGKCSDTGGFIETRKVREAQPPKMIPTKKGGV